MPKRSPSEHLRQLFDAGEVLSLYQVRQSLQLSERQARRIIDQLRGSGLPIQERYAGRIKVFSIPEQYQQVAVPDLRFDPAELRALTIAAKASRAVLAGTPHTDALQRAFAKLLEHARPVTYVFDLDEPTQEWHFDDNSADHIALDCFGRLETAMDEHQSVCMDYLTAKDQRQSTGRQIDPYFFAKRNRAWVLVAYCHLRREVRTFSLSRISRVDPCPETYYEIPGDFVPEHYFRSSLGAFTSGECYELRLLVEPDKAVFFRSRHYHATQQIEQERPDGRLVVSFELEGFDEMRSFCQGWGTGITVLAPDVLRERLHQEANELSRRYSAREPIRRSATE